MKKKNFIRTVETFKCENCGEIIHGNGYTNHCPHCLYSKHVDIIPGDRKSKCHGLMQPISIEKRGEETIIMHECVVCGHQKPNKSQPNDNIEEIIELSAL